MFFKKLGEYFSKHPIFLGTLIFALVALVVLIIVMIVVSKKRKLNNAKSQQTVKEEQAPEITEAQRAEQARAEAEAKRATREAIWARLDAEYEQALAEEAKKDEPKPKKTAPAKKAEPKKKASAVVAEEPKKDEPKPKKPATAKKAEPKKEKPAPVATPVEAEDETSVIAKYAGKWVIYHVLTNTNNPEDEMYFFELHASNGEKLFASEEYTSYNGAIKGIDTYKNNIAKDNFKISTTKKGDYIFKIMSGKNTLLCNGENYATKIRCESAMKSTKRFARTAIIDENVRDLVVTVPTETDTEITPLPEGLTGKWLISSRDVDEEKVYFFELFANNGEKLLSSEDYTTYIGAVNGIQTHKQNIAKGNFRISLTKNGDYIYKLLNGNNQLLCLGEHYKTKARCESAVESVQRFAQSSPTLTDSEHITE